MSEYKTKEAKKSVIDCLTKDIDYMMTIPATNYARTTDIIMRLIEYRKIITKELESIK